MAGNPLLPHLIRQLERIVQEHDEAIRSGRPLRIILQIDRGGRIGEGKVTTFYPLDKSRENE